VKITKSVLTTGALALVLGMGTASLSSAAESEIIVDPTEPPVISPFRGDVQFPNVSVGFGPANSNAVTKVAVLVNAGDEIVEVSASVDGFAVTDNRTGELLVVRYRSQATIGANIFGKATVSKLTTDIQDLGEGNMPRYLLTLTESETSEFPIQGRGRYRYQESGVIDLNTGDVVEFARQLNGNYAIRGRAEGSAALSVNARRDGLRIRNANGQASGSLGAWQATGTVRTAESNPVRFAFDAGQQFGSRATIVLPNNQLRVNPAGTQFVGTSSIIGVSAVFGEDDDSANFEPVIFESTTPTRVGEIRSPRRPENYRVNIQSRSYGRLMSNLLVDGTGPVQTTPSNIINPNNFASPFVGRQWLPLETIVSNPGAQERYYYSFLNTDLDD